MTLPRDGIGWIIEPAAGLEHADPVPLLRQPQGRDTAAEPRPDHQNVVIETTHRILSSPAPGTTTGPAAGTRKAVIHVEA